MITRLTSSAVTQGLPKYRSMLAGIPLPGYESIASQTLGSNTTTITFSSIPSTYQHLQIRLIGRFSDTGIGIDFMYVRFNGVTTSTYTRHRLFGDGTTVTAAGNASVSSIAISNTIPFNGTTAGIFGAAIIDIHDYASTTKNKTLRAFSGCDLNGTGNINLNSGILDSTSAITSIDLFGSTGNNWVTGSTFALYGIRGA